MTKINERSFGVVPLQFRSDGIYLFLIQNHSEAWLLPKGHAEEKESPKETAARELREETRLRVVEWLDPPSFVEHYSFMREAQSIHKEVLYFPARVEGDVALQRSELLDGRWIPADQFPELATFPEMKKVASAVISWLQRI